VNIVGFWSTFQAYFLWGLEVLWVPPMRTAGLISLGSVIAASLFQGPGLRVNWRRSYSLVFTQLIFYPLVIATAVVLRANLSLPIHPEQHRFEQHVLDCLAIASVLTGCFWVYRLRGLRWLAVSLVLVQEVVMFGGLVIAGMAVTGDWI